MSSDTSGAGVPAGDRPEASGPADDRPAADRPGVEIRPAVDSDLVAVAAVYSHYVRTSGATFDVEVPDREQWQRKFLDITVEQGLPFLVAESTPDGAVLGYAYVGRFRPKAAYARTVEDSIYLAPEARGRGMGRLLLEALLAEAAKAGCREVVAVISDTGDPASVDLHRRCGFREAGRLHRVGYKDGVWLDTVTMQYSIESAD